MLKTTLMTILAGVPVFALTAMAVLPMHAIWTGSVPPSPLVPASTAGKGV
jgi:hypothetical protein